MVLVHGMRDGDCNEDIWDLLEYCHADLRAVDYVELVLKKVCCCSTSIDGPIDRLMLLQAHVCVYVFDHVY